MKTKHFFLFGLILFVIGSCSKGPESRFSNEQITTSVEGTIEIDDGGFWDPTGLKIKCGNNQVVLDSTGNFFFDNITVDARIADVLVLKGEKVIMVKSFVPNNEHNYVRIQIWGTERLPGLPISTGIDYFSANTYGNAFKLQIPAGSFQGADYRVEFSHISPYNEIGAPDFLYGALPGNFITEDEQGNIHGLQIMSRIFYLSVMNSSGDLLPLVNGKKITIQKPNNFETAPGPFFLYFFDINKGVWKKVSDATFNSSTNQFAATSDSINGFFAFAYSFEVVKFKARIIGQNGNPVFSVVRVNSTDEKSRGYVAYPNRKGQVIGYMPKYVSAELSLLQSKTAGGYIYKNNELIFTKNLGTASSDVDLGDIICFNQGDTTKRAILTYKGRVVDCNGNPLSNIIISDGAIKGDLYPQTLTGTDGRFEINFTRGLPMISAHTIVFQDPVSNIKSSVLWPLASKNDMSSTQYDLGTITLCNSDQSEFMTFVVDGLTTYDYRPPSTPITFYKPSFGIVDPNATTNEFIKSATGNLFDVGFYGNHGIGQKQLSGFWVSFANVTQWLNAPFYATMTENRNSGSFYIAGHFENFQVRYADGTNHRIDGRFRVRNQ